MGVVFVRPLESHQRGREARRDSSGEPLQSAGTQDYGLQDHSPTSAFEDPVSCCFPNDFLASCRGLSWDSSVLVDFCSVQNNVLWILHFSAKKMSAAELDQTALQSFSADSF